MGILVHVTAMEMVSLDSLETGPIESDIDRFRLSEPLGTTDVAINRYRIEPGDGLPGGLHAHVDQEEVFLIFDGEATFETMSGAVSVGSGEAIRFGPGEFQSGKNDGEGDLEVLAIGAPRDSDDVRTPVTCPDCGHGDMRIETGEDGVRLVCPDCASSRIPEPCPECGSDDLRVTLSEDGETRVVCHDCGTGYETPPLREG